MSTPAPRIVSPRMSHPIKIAVVGGGYGAKIPCPHIRARRVRAGRRGAPAERAPSSPKHDVAVGTADLDELLGVEAEGRDVAGPVSQHAEVAIAAARRGLHVLCEKPLAASLERLGRSSRPSRSPGSAP